jgi:hypothetical protein
MADNYEYQRFELSRPTWGSDYKDSISRALQPFGEDAWEITYVGMTRDLEYQRNVLWVDARRPFYGSPGPSSWEYTGFNVFRMPKPAWYDHLASRGWQQVPDAWYSYYPEEWYVFKRTDVWRGTDDGDIRALLRGLGFNQLDRTHPTSAMRLPWRSDDPNSGKSLYQMVTEILDAKWQLSVEAGYDVGTQRAVESWRSNQ